MIRYKCPKCGYVLEIIGHTDLPNDPKHVNCDNCGNRYPCEGNEEEYEDKKHNA